MGNCCESNSQALFQKQIQTSQQELQLNEKERIQQNPDQDNPSPTLKQIEAEEKSISLQEQAQDQNKKFMNSVTLFNPNIDNSVTKSPNYNHNFNKKNAAPQGQQKNQNKEHVNNFRNQSLKYNSYIQQLEESQEIQRISSTEKKNFKDKLLQNYDNIQHKLKKLQKLPIEVQRQISLQKRQRTINENGEGENSQIDSKQEGLMRSKTQKRMLEEQIPADITKENHQQMEDITEIKQKQVSTKSVFVKTKENDPKIDPNSIFNPQSNNHFQAALFVAIKQGSIGDFYNYGKLLGEGGFGKVYVVTHKSTGIKRAMKTINKQNLVKEDEKKLFSELTLLKKLDHPNIVKLYELFQDNQQYYLITEFLSGGELFDRIKKQKQLTEKLAAKYMKQILAGLVYIHSKNIVHRDLKPENILFDSNSNDAILKIIDFGTARKMDAKKMLTKRIGTPYYMAPEVLKKSYNEKCDIWACGIIMYILLCGYPPFMGRTEEEIFRKIKNGKFEFHEKDWNMVSLDAKKLISKMLNLDISKRITAKEAFNDYWIQKNSHSQPLKANQLNNLCNFTLQTRLNQAIMTFIATQLVSNQEKQELSKTFSSLDKNGDGLLSKDEIIEGFVKLLKNNQEAKERGNLIFNKLGLKPTDKIDYTQFLVASLNKDVILSKKKIEQAFKIFDLDGNGSIDRAELEQIMGGTTIPESTWKAIINEIDDNGDGNIDYSEFVEILLKKIVGN